MVTNSTSCERLRSRAPEAARGATHGVDAHGGWTQRVFERVQSQVSRARAAGWWASAQRVCLACIGLSCGCGATDVIADLARDAAITSEAGASGAPPDAPA